jgi:chorismate mutase / prephenate dehydratase
MTTFLQIPNPVLPSLTEALNPLRQQIDALDAQILSLLNQRARVALQVGVEKHARGEPVYRPEREAQVLATLEHRNAGPLKTVGVQAIWREVMSACRAIEAITAVAYLGPAGTYSEQAVLQQFGNGVELMPCTTIDAVFRAVESGNAQFGVVPVENSTEGVVSRTLDLLLATSLSICAEVVLPIHHHLLSATGSLEHVIRIVGHAQTLAQCQTWLTANSGNMAVQAVSSNGEGARLASIDPTTAALAGATAQTHYGLHAVHERVQDDPKNRTRFAVIGTHLSEPSTHSAVKDQTSLILSVPNDAGAVYTMLKPLADHGVNMTRFESRPARTGAWDYYFYVDIAGHAKTASIAAALSELKETTAFYKLLGSYPLGA